VRRRRPTAAIRLLTVMAAATVLGGCRFHPADSRRREPPMDARLGTGDEAGLHARAEAVLDRCGPG